MIPHQRKLGPRAHAVDATFEAGVWWVSIAALGLALTTVQAPPGRPSSPAAAIRPIPGDAQTLTALATRRSPTLARLVHELERSTLVVYIEVHHNLRGGSGQMTLLTAAGGVRRIRIALDANLGVRDQIVVLGHELYHATELAGAPHVVDQQSLEEFYARIGFSVGRRCGRRFDTAEARATAWEIARELDTLRGLEGNWSPR